MKLSFKYSALILLLVVTVSLISVEAVEADSETLKIAIPGKAQTLDPAFLQRVLSDQPVMNSIYNGLVTYEPGTYDVIPELAKDWEISENDKEITFYLREGVEFHKGYGEFTAEDVKFSFERIIDPEKESPEAQSFAALEKVEVVDKYTAKLILEEPMARLFTSTLPYYPGYIVSKKAVEEMGSEDFAHDPVGTGPYVFEEWGINNDITLVRNDNYWQDLTPDYSEVTFNPMPDPTSQEMALQSGEIDIGEATLDNVEDLEEKTGLNVETYPDLAIQWVAFNVKKEPLDNKKLRKALRYIIDPEEILVGAFAGQAEKANSVLLPDMLGHWAAPEYDLDEVGEEKVWELLADAGYPEGEGLELEYLTDATDIRRQIATIIQAQLARFNIDLNIEAVEVGPKIDGWKAGDYHITYARFTNTVDPGYCLQWFLEDQIGEWNLMHWSDEEFDRLWQEAEKEMDKEKRAEMYREIQQIMDEDHIAVWVTHGVKTPTWVEDVDPVFTPDGVVLSWLVE